MILDRNEVEFSWWWKVLWKFRCPLKEKLFCRFLLSDKALTWDVICRKGREGPGRCYLCKMDSESNFHLGVECVFSKSVWFELESKLKIKNLWSGNLIISCLKHWCLNREVKHIRSLPVIVLWFLWEARNHSFFEDYILSSSQVSSLCLGLLSTFPQDKIVVRIRSVTKEVIDKYFPWGYFDGSTASDPKICGASDMLYISDGHYFSFKAGLGFGTNNFVELLGLKLLLTLALDKHLSKMHIFGDSQLVINWVTGKYRIQNIQLA